MLSAIREGKLPFMAAFFLALLLSYIPLARAPFMWMQTFFHEISHGLAALLTGGKPLSIELHWRGSGVCYSVGGIRFIVAFAGYAGAVLWGTLLYLAVDKMHRKFSDEASYLMALTIIVAGAFLARDVMTIVIMTVMAGTFFLFARKKDSMLVKIFLQIAAMFLLLDAIKSPLHLLDGRHIGDGATLADITGAPEIFWAGLWFALGCYALLYLYRASLKTA